MPSFTPPISRTATAASCCSQPCSACIRSCKSCLPTAAIRGRNSRRPWRKSGPTSKLKSSSVPITPKDLRYCRAVGSSSAPLLGSTDAEGLPRIGRASIERRSPSCASPQSASCSENSVIPLNVPGQTLSEEERFRVANDVVHQLQQRGNPWRLNEDLPPPSRGHST